MNRPLANILRRFTPKMLRSDSPNRPMVVRRKHWFNQETRFLFLTRKGPVEIIVKPALILGAAFAGFVGTGVIAAATLFVGYKSVEVVTNESITPAGASAPQMILPIENSSELALKSATAPSPLSRQPADQASPLLDGYVDLPADGDITKLAMAVTPPPSWPPSLAATDAAPDIVAILPPAAAPKAPYWPPSLASTGTVAPFTIPQMRAPASQPARALALDDLDSDHNQAGHDHGEEEAVQHNHDEPGTMVPLPSLAELADLNLPNLNLPNQNLGDPTGLSSRIIDIPSVAAPALNAPGKSVETVAMMGTPVTPPALPALPEDDFEMVPETSGDLPVFSNESRQRKLLRSMAREVRGIRQSLVRIGLPETMMPEVGALNGYVVTADFANLAMAVEDHRSMLRKVPLKPPMLYFYITSNYGWRKHPVLEDKRFHHGIDLAGTWQETVQAPAPGTVIFAGRKGSFGKVVQIQHAYGVVTTYAHLAKVTVRKGADVVPGTVIGKMGRTGRVAGAHLHYEIRLGDKSFDPQLFFDIGHRIGVGGELLLATDQP